MPIRTTRAADGSTHFTGCGPLTLTAGEHRISTTRIGAGPVVVDRLVLRTDQVDTATGPAGPGLDIETDADRHLSATTTLGEPFWLVLAESQNAGWQLSVRGGRSVAQAMVDGYANGWLVVPDGSGPVHVDLSWTPQRLVWIGFAITGVTILLALFVFARRRRDVAELADLARSPRPMRDGSPSPAVAVAVGLGLAVAAVAVADVEVAGLTVVALAVRLRWRRSTWPLATVAALSLGAAELFSRPSLVYTGLGILVAALAGDGLCRQPVVVTSNEAPG